MTWRRRIRTIPTMLAACGLALVGAPVIVPLALVVDLARGRRRFPLVRVYGFMVQYLVNDSVEILAAPLLWVAAGFGTRIDGAASVCRHRRLVNWSVDLLRRRADRWLGLRLEPDSTVAPALSRGPGPVIVVARHVSVLDASVPGIVLTDHGYEVRAVAMAELLADPGFDLIYSRLGTVFISRDEGQAAREAVLHMVEFNPAGTANPAGTVDPVAYLIFPEGRLFRPGRLRREMARLADTNPARADRLACLTGLLPPRPGGLLALLDALPSADLVVIDHTGLDQYPNLGSLLQGPATSPVTVSARRIPRSEIPSEPEATIAWLDRLWLSLDQTSVEERNDPF